MLETINNALLVIADPLMGWMLRVDRNIALVLLALMTALVLTIVRRWTTDQDLLKRCKEDKDRLKQLIREAKGRGDKAAIARHRSTMGQIGMKTMKAEGKPLLASIVPIAIIAVWAFSRIAFFPVADGEPVDVKLYFDKTEIGEIVHLRAQPGLSADNGWIQRIGDDMSADGQSVVGGVATWKLSGRQSDKPYQLVFAYKDRRYEKELLIGSRKYSDPLKLYEGSPVQAAHIDLKEFKPAKVVPGVPLIGLQPWIIGYLIIVFPLSLLLKPVLRIY